MEQNGKAYLIFCREFRFRLLKQKKKTNYSADFFPMFSWNLFQNKTFPKKYFVFQMCENHTCTECFSMRKREKKS